MAAEYVLDGYVLRVAIVPNAKNAQNEQHTQCQWHIRLQRLKTGEQLQFDSFQDLTDYLVLTSVEKKTLELAADKVK